jgi:hypothetical protein
MEHPTSESMNSAVENWRQELAAQAGLTVEIRRELEAHLQDCMAAFQRRGLSDSDSFQLARQRVGQPKQLGKEFKKAMNTSSHWNRPLTWAAWGMFILSFFLPSYTTMYGWQCATLQRSFWPGVAQGDLLSINYQLLILANLVMLASPLLLARFARNLRDVQWLHHVTLGAAILVWAFVLQLLVRPSTTGIKFGCFAWSVSFTLLYLSVYFQLHTMRKEATHQHA